MASRSPPILDTRGGEEMLRNTSEYAAAFDLEIWKAQQQARFRMQLKEAKEKLEKKILAEQANKEKLHVTELESTRRELEHMAQRLQSAGESLQKRSAQLDARELAFEARRVKVAEQHEGHLYRVEQRSRRAVEESASLQDALRKQLQERDVIISQLQERIHYAENNYDQLQRKTASLLADGDDVEGREAALEKQLHTAQTTIRQMQAQVADRAADAERLAKERDALRQQVRALQLQVDNGTARYDALCKQWHAREKDLLCQERQQLEEEKRRIQSAAQQPSERDGLHALIASLKSDVTSYLRPAAGGGPGSSAAQPPLYVVAEIPTESNTNSRRKRQEEKRSTHHQHTAATTRAHVPEQHEDVLDMPEVEISDVAAQSSTSATSCPPVEEPSWHSAEDDTARRSSTLPPLAPPATAETAVKHTTMPVVSPTPHDVSVAAQSATSDTRSEVDAFLQQLKFNRQKLLDTGVYTEDHPVVHEMNAKVLLYQQYLDRFTK